MIKTDFVGKLMVCFSSGAISAGAYMTHYHPDTPPVLRAIMVGLAIASILLTIKEFH